MTETDKKLLGIIIDYYNQNKLMPSTRYLQNKLNFKSTNAIYYYLNKLEERGYLKRNSLNNRILSDNYQAFLHGLKIIKIINSDEFVKIFLDDNNDYVAYRLKENIFDMKKNDILIIKKTNKLKNNDLGLFKINNSYYVMKYFYQDGFYILEGNNKNFYNQINIVGKVIYLERKIKRDSRPS